jgi:hypothetical protein
MDGAARLFGFDVSARLDVGDSGLSGGLSIDQPLTPHTTGIPGFELTAADDHRKGPHMTLATEGPTPLDLDLRMAVFGVDASAGVKLTDQGFTAGTTLDFDGNRLAVKCWFKPAPHAFSAGIVIKETLKNPIVIKVGEWKVVIKTVEVGMSADGFTYRVTGTKPPFSAKLDVHGMIRFKTIGNDLNKLMGAIKKDAAGKARQQ